MFNSKGRILFAMSLISANENNQVKNHYIFFDIAKGIGIILVVIGHCIPDATAQGGISSPFFKALHDIIYSFHMPLFFFIAGYFTGDNTGTIMNLCDKAERLRKRVNRLIIPYFVVGLCYAPGKIVLSQFANKPYKISDFWKILIGTNPMGELWFLYSLFIITLIALLLNNRISKLGLVIMLIINLYAPLLPIVTGYIFYFFLGLFFKQHNFSFWKDINYRLLFGAVVLFCGTNVLNFIAIRSSYISILTAVLGIYIVIVISKILETYQNKISKSLEILGLFSMDIYILSDIIKIPFRIILWNKMHLYVTTFIVCTVLSILLSYLISKYVIRRRKFLKKLILGL